MKKRKLTNSTTKTPMRPIIQALEFHISAVLVNPRNGAWNFGSTFGNSTWEKKEDKKIKIIFMHRELKRK